LDSPLCSRWLVHHYLGGGETLPLNFIQPSFLARYGLLSCCFVIQNFLRSVTSHTYIFTPEIKDDNRLTLAAYSLSFCLFIIDENCISVLDERVRHSQWQGIIIFWTSSTRVCLTAVGCGVVVLELASAKNPYTPHKPWRVPEHSIAG
jgi:hypothetical protein